MFSRVKWGIIIVLVLGIGALGWMYRAEIKESAQLAQTVVQQRTTLQEMEKEAERLREQREKAEKIATEYKQKTDQIKKEARDLRDEIRELEEQNKEVRDWADNNIPDAVLNRLHGNKDNNQD